MTFVIDPEKEAIWRQWADHDCEQYEPCGICDRFGAITDYVMAKAEDAGEIK